MLSKLPTLRHVPGKPAVPARPEQTICSSAPTNPSSGSWQVECGTGSVFIGWDYGPASFDNPGPFPKAVFLTGQPVCRSVWKPSGVAPQPSPPIVCQKYPAVPAVPGVPARVDSVAVRAWDAGANSVQVLSGNVRTRFKAAAAIGLIVGLTSDRDNRADPSRMTHGFAFTLSPDGAPLAQVREGAVVRTAPISYTPDLTEFEIRRSGSSVQYLVSGALVYSSRVPSHGEISVGCAVYATGDSAP